MHPHLSHTLTAVFSQGTWKLRSTEEIFAALEDNGVALSSMKASKYYTVFEKVCKLTLAAGLLPSAASLHQILADFVHCS